MCLWIVRLQGVCSLEKVTYLVLDEADRMLDMGFEREVRAILSKIPNKDRQTLMFRYSLPLSLSLTLSLAFHTLTQPKFVLFSQCHLAQEHPGTERAVPRQSS